MNEQIERTKDLIEKLPDSTRMFWPVPDRPSKFYCAEFTTSDLKQLARASQWVSVEDRLPPDRSTYLVSTFAALPDDIIEYVTLAYLSKDRTRWVEAGTWKHLGEVTAWQSEPPPYQPEQEQP